MHATLAVAMMTESAYFLNAWQRHPTNAQAASAGFVLSVNGGLRL